MLMNKKSLFLSFVAAALVTSVATAGTLHGSGGGRGHFTPSGGGFARGGMGGWRGGNWGGGNWNGRWGGDWHHGHHHHDFNDFVFVGSFGFPFWGWGWGYPWGYPYGYGYGYGPGYGPGYYGSGYYGAAYYPGGDYGYRNYGSQSGVAQLQRRLARAGYYRGPIDGIMGPRTRYALRAYQHDHGTADYQAMGGRPL